MTEKAKMFGDIDSLIETVHRFKNEPIFSEEQNRRQNKTVSALINDNEIWLCCMNPHFVRQALTH